MRAVDSKEAEGSLARDSNCEELVIRSYVHIDDLVSEEVLAIIAVVDCICGCFVLDIDEELLSVHSDDKGLVFFDCSQAFDLCDWEFLLLLESSE